MKTVRSDVHPLHLFHPWQVWPGAYDSPPADGNYPRPDLDRPIIGPRTPVAGIGSCFIREIKDRLLAAGYAFLTAETDKKESRHASAAWERMYNLCSVRQVIQYALEGLTPLPRWWRTPVTGRVQDPYRRLVVYDDQAQAEADFARHIQCAREVLTSAKVLILSLDYVEIWEDRTTGAVICLPSGPYFAEGGDLSAYRCRSISLAENIDQLEAIRTLLARHNPDCRLVIMLSPIQLWATFRTDLEIFSASQCAKAILRVAADEFTCRHPEVSYFPAYEMAMLHRPLLGQNPFAEGREAFHMSPDTLDHLATQFIRWYGP